MGGFGGDGMIEGGAAMFFHITELEHHPILFDVTYAPGEIELGEDLEQQGDLKASGSAELLKNTLGEIRIRGKVTATVSTACDRCLEPAQATVDTGFDLYYKPVVKTGMHGEVHLEEGEIDLAFYEGDGVALTDALRDFVLLSLPMKFYCREECKGLCPVCGGNRNTQACSCEVKPKDERWEALRNL